MATAKTKEDIQTITKHMFLEYAKQRKSLDTEFGKPIVQKFKNKEESYEAQKERQKARYQERMKDPEYKAKQRERGRMYYARKKELQHHPSPVSTVDDSERPPSPACTISEDESVAHSPVPVPVKKQLPIGGLRLI